MVNESLINDIGKILVFLMVILSVYLVSVRNQRKLPRYLFAAFILVTAVDFTGLFMDWSRIPNFLTLKLSSVLLQMPLFLLYVLSACYFNFRLKSIHILHGFPFVVFSLAFIFMGITDNIYAVFDAISTVQYYVYIAAVIYTLVLFKRVYKANYSSNHEMTYKWLLRTTILFLVGNCFVVIRNLMDINSPAMSYMVLTTSCFALIVMCWFVLSGLHHPDLFSGVDQKLAETNSHQIGAKKQEDLSRLLDYIEREKPYLNDALTLQHLAQEMEVSEKELSSMINKGLGKHFFDFINGYRIQDAKQLLKEQPSLTVLEILYNVGFNSKSSFYTAFKKETGMTPTSFRKSKD